MNKKAVDISSIDLERLGRRLRYGDKKRVAERSGYSDKYVYAVLDPNNKRMNKEIIQTAIELIEEGRPVEVSEDLAKELVA